MQAVQYIRMSLIVTHVINRKQSSPNYRQFGEEILAIYISWTAENTDGSFHLFLLRFSHGEAHYHWAAHFIQLPLGHTSAESVVIASGISRLTERRDVKLELQIIDLAKLVGQGLCRSKTFRSSTIRCWEALLKTRSFSIAREKWRSKEFFTGIYADQLESISETRILIY